MIGLGIKNYNTPSMGRKMYGSSKIMGQKIYTNKTPTHGPHIVSDPEALYNNSHNSNIAYVPFGTQKLHLHDDKLNLHGDPVFRKHDGNLTRKKFYDEPPAAARKHKLFK